MHRITAAAVLSLFCVSCGQSAPAPTPMAPAPDASLPTKASRFEPRLLEIAKAYLDYGRVDDEARWAPWLCRMPNPSTARFSASSDEHTHGQKLYFMFASDRNAYVGGSEQPVGQVVVKESWLPSEVGEAPKREWGQPVTVAQRDGRLWHASVKGGLYIMYRTESATDTDEGWVYGTVTPDGARVTSAGRVASCMGCHTREADRIFGLPK